MQLQNLVGLSETAVYVVSEADEVLVSRVLGAVLDDDRVGGRLASLPVTHRLCHVHYQQWVPGVVVQWHGDHWLYCPVSVYVHSHHLNNTRAFPITNSYNDSLRLNNITKIHVM